MITGHLGDCDTLRQENRSTGELHLDPITGTLTLNIIHSNKNNRM
jgi:hypothetical protein